MGRSNIYEVAKLAKVSPATVSRVLNSSSYVSHETRKRVNRAIQQLGFRPNTLAKKLRDNQPKYIGLIIPDIENAFFAKLAKSIETTLQKERYALFLCNTEENPEKEDFYITSLLDNQVDAIIITPSTATISPKLSESSLPIVLVDRVLDISAKNIVGVTSDNNHGGRLAAEKLVSTGAREILILRDHRSIGKTTEDRVESFTKYLKEYEGIHYKILETQVSPEAGFELMESVIAQKASFDSVFCTTDTIAIGVIKSLQNNKIDIPQTVQVIGYDGILFPEYFSPSLSTIAQDAGALGRVIAESVVALTQQEIRERQIVIPVSYVEGETTR